MKKFFTLVAMALMAVGANAQELIAEVDFTTATEFTGWNQFGDGQEGSVELKAGEGLAITVGSQTGQLWQPQTMVIPDGTFNVEEDGNYKVVVEAKFPTAGELQINMGTWASNDQTTAQVPASDDFQTVEIEFPAFAYTLEGCHLLFQNGDFLGTTIVKSVKVIDLSTTGIEAVKANKAFDGAIYNLAGQKVNANYKGVVIQNGKKFIQK